MSLGWLQALGGLGIFLLGMIIMVEGLHAGAGEGLQRVLCRFTRSPATGALTGALSTAVLQSSSATTIASVGFVSAGLLSFPQALGIIYGANLGTTVTGWLVLFFGFKLKLGVILLPLILVGVMMRLLVRGRVAELGSAVSGFGLIFLGITQMQLGMQGFEGWLTPALFPDDTWSGRVQLVIIGTLVTIITQSSSAGVAAMLTLLYADHISFSQAAVVVIGMDLGTSVKAVLATIGGRVEARRTGISHLIFNVATVFIALALLDPFIALWHVWSDTVITDSAELALVAFHSFFNLAAVLLLLPFVRQFAAFIQWIIKAKGRQLDMHLEPMLLKEPAIAIQAVRPGLGLLRDQVVELLRCLLCGQVLRKEDAADLQQALDQMHAFLDGIHLKPEASKQWQTLTSMLHCMDHLQRLHERCDEEPERALMLQKIPMLRSQVDALKAYLDNGHTDPGSLVTQHQALLSQQDVIRHAIIAEIVAGHLDVEQGTDQLEALRWLVRVLRHQGRIDSYLQKAV
ncbi:MAG: Na/Pi cotransporter family protein [Pontibacterium sp.]